MDSTVSTPLTLSRDLAIGVLGSAAFGVAAAAGYGARTMLNGAWVAPALFAGGALLATPPLYIMTALSGGTTSPADIAGATGRALAAGATVLFGLAAPVAFFSVTLRTRLALALLFGAVIVVGGISILVAGGSTAARESSGRAGLAGILWCVFALTLGARLISSLGPIVFGGGGW